MKRLLPLLMLLVSASAWAQVSITALSTAYTQNFNTLDNTTGVTGSSVALPTGWLIFENGTGTSPLQDGLYAVDNGTLNNGNAYSYGAPSSTDRALGLLQSGSVNPSIGVAFTNNTGGVINSLTISYRGEMWRIGVTNRGGADRIDFQYSIDASSLSTGTWTDINSLDYSSSVISGTTGPLDGNATGNFTNVSSSITGLNIPNGATFYLRWTDFNIASNDDGLGVDDFSLTAEGTPGVFCSSPSAAPTNLVLTTASTAIAGSFTGSASADGYVVFRSTSSSLGFTPFDGIPYTAGQTVGTGVVVYTGTNTSFSATGLTAGTQYYFFVFSLNGFACSNGPLYFGTSLNGSATTTTGSTNDWPEGYYDGAIGLSCAPLKTALKTAITTGNTPKTYGDLWTQYLISDIKPREVGTGSANVIWDIYSDNPTGTDPYNFTPGTVASGGQQDDGSGGASEGDRYNREHTVPLSWFDGNTGSAGAATDYLHIMPTDKFVNNQRGSYIYGEVSNPTWTSQNGSKLGPNSFAGLTGTAFEPINEYKGDVARAFLYFVTRYQDNMTSYSGGGFGTQAFDNSAFPSVDIDYLRLMIKWHNQDPVSQKERDRNNAAYTFQRNRNPYIDRPEYVSQVWNSTCAGLGALPVTLEWFKGALKGTNVQLEWQNSNEANFSRYEIQRSVNGTDYQTIATVNGRNIRNYTYSDDVSKLGGRRLYYRLNMVDKDGSSKLSSVFTIHLQANVRFQVYPNPASSNITVELGSSLFSGSLIVTDMTGRSVYSRQLSNQRGQVAVSVQQLPAGRYLVQLKADNGTVSSQSFNVAR
ncbi:MAG: endonuclease [Chitinophagaceae bacterium]|nr:endonuclease [Chitinophagaceae bacterium]